MDLDLSGRVALVTGGGRGIGRAIALELAALGASVAVNYAHGADAAEAVVAEITAAGGRAIALQADVSDGAAAAGLVEAATSELGNLAVLVNNAGITRDNLLMRMKDEEWRQVLETDLSGAFYTSRAALRPMLKARWGRIVNVASVAGTAGNAGQANYSAAKAGLIGLTRTVAAEVARRKVTVNAVAPGFVSTDMTADIGDEVLQAIPARRAGTPEEVAACVRFLASEDAAYVTGMTLTVDGGMTA
ncbi:MAG: 3-oxoacyl-[acyl-carrier-protein] reductase [Candidatus Dormibacteria bacterium]